MLIRTYHVNKGEGSNVKHYNDVPIRRTYYADR